MYLGAHAEAYAEGDAIGVAKSNQVRWSKDTGGARQMGSSLAQSAKGFRMKERLASELIRVEEREKMERGR